MRTKSNVLDVRVGDTVEIQRAGDVIPQVLRVLEADRAGRSEEFTLPKTCPICGADAVRDIDDKGNMDVIRRCTNGLQCPAQAIESLRHFVSRRAYDIDGMGGQANRSLLQKRSGAGACPYLHARSP